MSRSIFVDSILLLLPFFFIILHPMLMQRRERGWEGWAKCYNRAGGWEGDKLVLSKDFFYWVANSIFYDSQNDSISLIVCKFDFLISKEKNWMKIDGLRGPETRHIKLHVTVIELIVSCVSWHNNIYSLNELVISFVVFDLVSSLFIFQTQPIP